MAKGEPTLSLFRDIVGSVDLDDEKRMRMKVRGEGTDPEKVAEMFTEMQTGVAMGKGAMKGLAAANKDLQPFADAMDSVTLKQDGATVTGEAVVPAGAGGMPFIFFFSAFGVRAVAPAPIEPDAVELIEPEVDIVPLEAAPDLKPVPDVKAEPEEVAPPPRR